MSDLNKAPNDFFGNWNKIQSMLYKNVIELLVKRSSEKKILALIQFELDQFSENVQNDLAISETSSFYQEISSLLRDSNWWSTATVTDACKYYLNIARNNISYFDNYVEADSNLSQNQKIYFHQNLIIYLNIFCFHYKYLCLKNIFPHNHLDQYRRMQHQ